MQKFTCRNSVVGEDARGCWVMSASTLVWKSFVKEAGKECLKPLLCAKLNEQYDSFVSFARKQSRPDLPLRELYLKGGKLAGILGKDTNFEFYNNEFPNL